MNLPGDRARRKLAALEREESLIKDFTGYLLERITAHSVGGLVHVPSVWRDGDAWVTQRIRANPQLKAEILATTKQVAKVIEAKVQSVMATKLEVT